MSATDFATVLRDELRALRPELAAPHAPTVDQFYVQGTDWHIVSSDFQAFCRPGPDGVGGKHPALQQFGRGGRYRKILLGRAAGMLPLRQSAAEHLVHYAVYRAQLRGASRYTACAAVSSAL
jgi:hypothetical protein